MMSSIPPPPEEYSILVKIRGTQVSIYGVDEKTKIKLKEISERNESTNNS